MTAITLKNKVNGDSIFNRISFTSALLIFITLLGIVFSLIEGGWLHLRNLAWIRI